MQQGTAVNIVKDLQPAQHSMQPVNNSQSVLCTVPELTQHSTVGTTILSGCATLVAAARAAVAQQPLPLYTVHSTVE
jgi:hypothetical protein